MNWRSIKFTRTDVRLLACGGILVLTLFNAIFVRVTMPLSGAELATLRGKIGFSSIPISSTTSGKNFKVAFSTFKMCSFGHLDAISEDLKHSKNSQLWLTVESLIPGDQFAPVVAQEVTLDQLNSNLELEIKLPLSLASQGHLGLFLCKSSGDLPPRCGDKPSGAINKSRDFYLTKTVSRFYRAPDRNYYFQYLIVDRDQLLLMNQFSDPENKELLQAFFTETLHDKIQSRELATKIEDNIQNVTLTPADINGSKAEFVLVKFDQTACQAPANGA